MLATTEKTLTTVLSPANKQANTRIGSIIVFTGNGKGKTTAAIGTAVRASGHGYRICLVFFFKGNMSAMGEIFSLQKLKNCEINCFGVDKWIKIEGNEAEAKTAAKQALQYSVQAMESERFDMVVLDEINCATAFKLIAVQDVVDMLNKRKSHVDVILTGRHADERILAMADTVTEMKSIKHAYEHGIGARMGIEY